jgi:extracellular factor (EF) 3-hydroxypalmitic acid methyl ester biosynthesis protein
MPVDWLGRHVVMDCRGYKAIDGLDQEGPWLRTAADGRPANCMESSFFSSGSGLVRFVAIPFLRGIVMSLSTDFFSVHVAQFTRALAAFEQQIPADAEATSDEVLEQLTSCINTMLGHCTRLEAELKDDGKVLKETQVRFREAIAPWFEKSWCMQRAFTKPRGYPGDYELLTAIYNRTSKSLGLGGYFDRYFLDTTLGQAVPARMRSAREFLLSEIASRPGKVTILNVACGACREYTEGFDSVADREIELTLVDNDPLALDFVQTNVAAKIPSNIALKYVRYNALRMTNARVNVERFNRNDIIYSVGLCDYIPDEYLVPMLKGWRESVADDGVVFVAFKDMAHYTTAEYQWLVDWYFYQRSVEDCRQLFVKAGFDERQIEMSRSETAVIINFAASTSKPAFIRIDDASRSVQPQHLEPEVRVERVLGR